MLLEHAIQQPEDAVANDLFVGGKPTETGIAREQRAAGSVGQGQREGIGQRESGDSPVIRDCPGNRGTVELDDSETHGEQALAAVRFQLAPVEQIGHPELEAQGEGRGEEGTPFEVDEHGRVRYDHSKGHSSTHGRQRGEGSAHVLVDFDNADVEELRRFGLADCAFGERAKTEPVEPARLLAGH